MNKRTIVATVKFFKANARLSCSFLFLSLVSVTAGMIDWETVQKQKAAYLADAATHAMEMQKTREAAPLAIVLHERLSTTGKLTLSNQEPGAITVKGMAAPRISNREPVEKIHIRLARPIDMFSQHTGLAMTVRNASETSPEVRIGLQLFAADGSRVQVQPIIPALSAWTDREHELYFDWSLLDFSKEEQAVAVLKAVSRMEITFGSQRRAPSRGASQKPQKLSITLADLRLVDYHRGNFDPSRRSLKFNANSRKWEASEHFDLTLQHRYQEVTGIVAAFGNAAGKASAIDALDMAVRTQCWDGSFQDGRRGATTVASGEYTFGFTLYGLLQGYQELEKAKHPALSEVITIGPYRMTRRDFYQRMFYRGAMSRTIATPSAYRDDIIGGNTLINGANRVLGYAIAMRMIADVLTDPFRKKQVMDKYKPIMEEIADAQGKFSGGFPVLGEGDKYQGRGIHYDAGYTRTHMDWLVVGLRQTGDPLLLRMLQRYQTVFEAAMDEKGLGILPMISERHQGNSPVRLILPDATYQVGIQYKLPVIAQWGYNVSRAAWPAEGQPRNHFSTAANARGYTLGAHMSVLLDDMKPLPAPSDPGYLFPRQFTLWSTRVYSKESKLLRTSSMTFQPDGSQETDYRIDVGEYPQTVGVPVLVKSSLPVIAVAHELSGWPGLLPAGAAIKVTGDQSRRGRLGKPLKFKLKKETRFIVTGPDTILPDAFGGRKIPFKAEFSLSPVKPGQVVEITVLRGTVPYQYKAVSK